MGVLVEVGIAAAAVTAIIAAGYAIAKLPPLRWLWCSVIARGWAAVVTLPISRWLGRTLAPIVEAVVKPIKDAINARLDAEEAVSERIEGKVDELRTEMGDVHTDVKIRNGTEAPPPAEPPQGSAR